ncbi:MAG TPA: hypothetical protein VMV89_08790 [Candidatus Paceibacterota bacterium]|nr:hypothetical protein [Candidatus Paceibacterota bacterium]
MKTIRKIVVAFIAIGVLLASSSEGMADTPQDARLIWTRRFPKRRRRDIFAVSNQRYFSSSIGAAYFVFSDDAVADGAVFFWDLFSTKISRLTAFSVLIWLKLILPNKLAVFPTRELHCLR